VTDKSDPAGHRDDPENDDIGSEHTLPGAVLCPVCGLVGAERFCPGCGLEVLADEPAAEPDWPRAGDRLDEGERPVVLSTALPAPPGVRRFLGTDDQGARCEVLVVPRAEGSVLASRAEARALLEDAALAPSWAFDRADLRFTVTHLPAGARSVSERLAALVSDRAGPEPLDAVRAIALPVARFLADLHEEGRFIGELDPAELLLDEEGRCLVRDPHPAQSLAAGPLPAEPRRVAPGFSAPELYGRCGGQVGPAADVFFAGAVLYYTLARISPLADAADPHDRLPPPRVYFPRVPPELAAVALRAVSPLPGRRYANATAFRDALGWAIAMTERRRDTAQRRLQVDIGHELHVGVLKGQFSPTNQDDMFLAYDGKTGIGLFVIGDGVSISEYGSGDLASTCVRLSALATWRQLCGAVGDGAGEAPPRLPDDEGERRLVLQRMLDQANARIAGLVHEALPRFPGPPEGIMASTCVAALVEGNRVTLSAIGDSRIYLVREGHIASLMVDDDFQTQLLRMGRTPSVARQVPSGGALVRCVGEFDKDGDDRLVPVPLEPEFRELRLLPGDMLVLTSDGVPDYGGLDEEDAEENIRRAVETAPGAPWAAFELVVLANHGGGGDNIGCIVLRFGSTMHDAEGGR
jgi:protein phosphatase